MTENEMCLNSLGAWGCFENIWNNGSLYNKIEKYGPEDQLESQLRRNILHNNFVPGVDTPGFNKLPRCFIQPVMC
jgi:hypothetical protein